VSDTITQYAIYERPSDFRDGYVVRQWLISGDEIQPGDATRHPSLEEARASLPPGAVKVSGVDPKEPTIIEVWM
jgi:hypothetical protein